MSLFSDVRFAVAMLRRRPVVPLLVAGLLALSVGVAGGLWAVIDAVALRPLPYPDADRLVAVVESHPERGLMSVTAANYWDWSPRMPALEHVAGLGSLEASLSARGTPVRVIGTRVTEQFFGVIGVMPALGRPFSDDDFRGDGRAVIISDTLWDRQLGRSRDALGSLLLIDGTPYTLVGVMPGTFRTIGHSDVWVPWMMTAEERAERRFHMVGVMARMRPGRAAADAERDLQAIYRQLAAEHPDTVDRWTARVIPLRDLMLGDSRTALQVLGGAVVALVIVAAVNIAGLMLAWLRQRQRELVVRTALGASSSRLVRQLLVETAVWAAGGLAAGIGLAHVFVQLFGAVAASPTLEYDFEPRVDWRVAGAMAALLIVVAVVTTVLPAWRSAQTTRLAPGRALPAGAWGHRLAIAAQVALSLVLLCTAAALLGEFTRIVNATGSPRTLALAADISLAETRYRDETSQARFFERLLAALSDRPEVARAGAASYIPPGRIFGNVRFAIEGRDGPTDSQTTLMSVVDTAALDILGVRVLRGRAIEYRDDGRVPHVGVISAALARRYWPNEDPIGRRIVPVGATTALTIVGVADDVRQPLSTDSRAESVLYVPYQQVPLSFMSLLIEPAVDPAPALAALREEVARLDPAQAVGAARPIDEIRQEWMTQPRLRSQIVVLFGIAALLLTLVGLWARVSYGVASRVRELAIRQAIGARPSQVVFVAAREALSVVMAGVAGGLALLPATGAATRSVVAGLPPPEPWLPALAALGFLVLAAASAYFPARRAARIDPALALRAE